MNTHATLLAALRRLRDEGPIFPSVGICGASNSYVYALLDAQDAEGRKRGDIMLNALELLRDTFERLGYDRHYPVAYPASWKKKVFDWAHDDEGITEPTEVDQQEAAYGLTGNKWVGEYGVLRRNLLVEVIRYLEEHVR